MRKFLTMAILLGCISCGGKVHFQEALQYDNDKLPQKSYKELHPPIQTEDAVKQEQPKAKQEQPKAQPKSWFTK